MDLKENKEQRLQPSWPVNINNPGISYRSLQGAWKALSYKIKEKSSTSNW